MFGLFGCWREGSRYWWLWYCYKLWFGTIRGHSYSQIRPNCTSRLLGSVPYIYGKHELVWHWVTVFCRTRWNTKQWWKGLEEGFIKEGSQKKCWKKQNYWLNKINNSEWNSESQTVSFFYNYKSVKMMSSVLYLEQFLESLEPLPAELKKNFNEMRTMDEKVEMQKGLAESMGEVKILKIFKKIWGGIKL